MLFCTYVALGLNFLHLFLNYSKIVPKLLSILPNVRGTPIKGSLGMYRDAGSIPKVEDFPKASAGTDLADPGG